MQALFLGQHDAWLRYHDLPGREPACVYLHGLACAASSDFPALATQPPLADRRALLVDLLGFGFSDRPAGFSYAIEDHAATVAALLDHLGLTGCAVIGHSMGGSVAIVLATLQAGDVASVPGDVSGEVRNSGQEPASALVVLIAPNGMMMGEATPAP